MSATPARFASLDAATVPMLVAWGLTVWAAVAGFIRLAGHVLLDPTRPLVVGGFFLAVIPLMAVVTYPIYRRLEIEPARRPVAAAVMSLPGMFLDVLLVLGAAQVFPAMNQSAVATFGAILLFGYSIVLLTGFIHPTKVWTGVSV